MASPDHVSIIRHLRMLICSHRQKNSGLQEETARFSLLVNLALYQAGRFVHPDKEHMISQPTRNPLWNSFLACSVQVLIHNVWLANLDHGFGVSLPPVLAYHKGCMKVFINL